MPRFLTSTQTILRPKIDEVHTIEDDLSGEQQHNVEDTVVCTYQPSDRVLCKVYNSDLATLGPTEMLNDTIIDFYMNYILHDLVPAEM
jgi:Ulp1 family protease